MNECRTVKQCRVCNGQHHTLLQHSGANPSTSSSMTLNSIASGSSKPEAAATTTHVHNALISSIARSQTILATTQVQIISAQGQCIFVRILLDQGSELSFVCESIAQLLRLPRQHSTLPILGIGLRSAGSTRGIMFLRKSLSWIPRSKSI